MIEIKPQYEHSKVGTFMFNLCAKWTKVILKHKWLYYVLACTWGILMTFIGWIITIILWLFVKDSKPIKYNWIYYMKAGPDYWGGFEMGLMFVRDQKSSDSHINQHEFGHTFQNCLLGPLMPFIVSIPSACRWWARTLKPNKDWPAYSAVWFEDAADVCGKYAAEYLGD